MNQYKELHMKLKELREQNGYSQSDLAKLLNVSRQAISRWETGNSSPDIQNLCALCNLYKISLDELLGITVEKPEPVIQNTIFDSSPEIQYSVVVEILCIALVLAITHQIVFLNTIVPPVILIWLKYTNKKYTILYVLCVICLLLGLYNTCMFFHLGSF